MRMLASINKHLVNVSYCSRQERNGVAISRVWFWVDTAFCIFCLSHWKGIKDRLANKPHYFIKTETKAWEWLGWKHLGLKRLRSYSWDCRNLNDTEEVLVYKINMFFLSTYWLSPLILWTSWIFLNIVLKSNTSILFLNLFVMLLAFCPLTWTGCQ